MSIKTLEERIVNLKKVSAGVETTEQAELRQLDMRGEDPYRITVVLAKVVPDKVYVPTPISKSTPSVQQ